MKELEAQTLIPWLVVLSLPLEIRSNVYFEHFKFERQLPLAEMPWFSWPLPRSAFMSLTFCPLGLGELLVARGTEGVALGCRATGGSPGPQAAPRGRGPRRGLSRTRSPLIRPRSVRQKMQRGSSMSSSSRQRPVPPHVATCFGFDPTAPKCRVAYTGFAEHQRA